MLQIYNKGLLMRYGSWEPVIGLEIHVQLKTKSKLFSPDPNQFSGGDNEHTHPVSLGLPGTLPSLNKEAVRQSVLLGLALGCQIREQSRFVRKNYFYPDMPKGYQISQLEAPLCENGEVQFYVKDKLKKISIDRAHMEEDAGKSTHHGSYSLINLNRAGTPLLEVVSAPEMHAPEEAAEFAREMRRIVRYLGVCDGNLEEGSMRCDCNVSVRPLGSTELGTKVELKNINSFRFVEKAVEFEIFRQIETLEAGQKLVQETRLYDSTKNKTFSMRRKEESHDYRYFPEPDLPILSVPSDFIEALRGQLPELPSQKMQRFISQYGLNAEDVHWFCEEPSIARYYEYVTNLSGNPKASANWIMVELARELKEAKLEISESPLSAKSLAKLIQMVDKNTISGKIAKKVFQLMWEEGKEPEVIVKEQGLIQITDVEAIEEIVSKVIQDYPDQVEEFRQGKQKVLGFFVGQVMKASRGQASPELVNQLLRQKLKGKKS
jgi:aspartyl-tRNA(Asn)/glutamyl-tRNA(Gln) amidotransferase subunit B